MSHERSITIQNRAGKWINLPSVVNGTQLTEPGVKNLYEKGHLKPLGNTQYDNVDDAVKAAKERSRRAK